MLALHIRKQRRFQRRIRQFVDTQSAKQGIAAHAPDQIGAPGQHPRLRTAQQLVAAVSHHIDAGAQTLCHARLAGHPSRSQVENCPAPQILHQGNPAGQRQLDQFVQTRLLRKTRNLEIRAVHAQQNARFFVDGLFVVADAGTVRRAHLPQNPIRLLHHVGNAK